MNVDMSPAAITIRLKRVSQVRRLCLELAKMKPVMVAETSASYGPRKDPRPAEERSDKEESSSDADS